MVVLPAPLGPISPHTSPGVDRERQIVDRAGVVIIDPKVSDPNHVGLLVTTSRSRPRRRCPANRTFHGVEPRSASSASARSTAASS